MVSHEHSARNLGYKTMRIGIDFDNTIVCYDEAIAVLAEELVGVPPEVPRTKLALRNFLRANERTQEWTSFQGRLYGPGMNYAKPFDGAIETMKTLAADGHELSIISHRTRRPYAGTPYDLHEAAKVWVDVRLRSIGLFIGENRRIKFLETRDEKVACIAEHSCDAFIDDLPEVLQAPSFPTRTIGILFDPSGAGEAPFGCRKIKVWPELTGVLATINRCNLCG